MSMMAGSRWKKRERRRVLRPQVRHAAHERDDAGAPRRMMSVSAGATTRSPATWRKSKPTLARARRSRSLPSSDLAGRPRAICESGRRHCQLLRHRAVRVQREAAAAQTLVDVFRQQAEVVVDGRVVGVVVREPVVLVGDEVELAAGGAAERQPGVGDRRLAAPLDGELQHALRHRVVEQREDARHRGRVQVRGHQADEELRHVGRGLDDVVQGARVVDRAAQREGAARVQRHQAAGGEDADDVAIGIHDRQVVRRRRPSSRWRPRAPAGRPAPSWPASSSRRSPARRARARPPRPCCAGPGR